MTKTQLINIAVDMRLAEEVGKAVAAEREACAKIAQAVAYQWKPYDGEYDQGAGESAEQIERLIRARAEA